MGSGSALSVVSSLLTYLFKSTAAYLLLCLLSRFVRTPQIRFRLHGVFLSGAVATWLYLLLAPGLRVLPEATGTAGAIISARHLSLSVNPALLPGLTKGLAFLSWGYAIIFALLVARFCGHSWQLRNFLRASQPPPDALSLLFELVRSKSGSPPCELRLVEDLRSPATTGWWYPRVLLPRELLLRLRAGQLVHIFQHELMHVRRRDYLWDRLSTFVCCLIFFHPAAWLARRRLRWERELVCDEDVAQGSEGTRLEYASCLTTLANWWFLGEQVVGQVDFLSSPPSLLAARVRALLMHPAPCGSWKKAGLTVSSATVLTICALLLPEFAISSYHMPSFDLAHNRLFPQSERMTKGGKRAHVSRAQKPDRSLLPAVTFASSARPANLSLPVVLPRLSSSEGDPFDGSPRGGASETPADGNAGSDRGLQAVVKVWDESPPQAPRTRASKIGLVARRVLKFGIGVAASRIGGHEHEREP